MTDYTQINLTEGPDNPGHSTFDASKIEAGGLTNEQVLDVLLKTLQPLGKAMQLIVRPGTGVAIVETGGKMEIIAIADINSQAAAKVTDAET